MSYAGNVSRTRGGRSAPSTGTGRAGLSTVSGSTVRRPRHGGPGSTSRSRGDAQGETDIAWRDVAILSAGIALGLAVGAGSALLLAPESGEELRAAITRRGRRVRRRAHDAWDDLRDELRFAARRGRRRVRRAMDDRGFGARTEDCD